jgi:N-carbamoylputrescine amidase
MSGSVPERPIRVAMEQVAVQAGATADNRELALARSRSAMANGADVVVLPELAISGYSVDPSLIRMVAEPLDGPSAAAFSRVAAGTEGLIAYGFTERAGTDFFNSVVMVDGSGPVLHYRKLHLFDQEKNAYTPGDLGLPVVNTAFGRVGVCICYDLRFVEVLRIFALADADLVLAPAAWVAGFDAQGHTHRDTRHAETVMAQANLNQVAVVAVSQVTVDPAVRPTTLGGSVACNAFGQAIAGPLSRTEPDSAVAVIDIAEGRAARVRSSLIRPREDRRTDVYGIDYGGRVW